MFYLADDYDQGASFSKQREKASKEAGERKSPTETAEQRGEIGKTASSSIIAQENQRTV